MVNKNFQIRLPAVHDSLREVYRFIKDVSTELELNEQTHFDIELSIEEALTNVITHAYEDQEGDFVLTISNQNRQIVVTIQDWGTPFDPQHIKPFDYNAPVETRINGGMGMHFMRTLMDGVTFQFDEVEGTILTMTKKLDAIPDPPHFEEQIAYELQVLDEVARAISTEHNVDALLDLIIDKLTAVVSADRGTLYLIDQEKNELYSKILQDETGRLREIRLKIGEGIAGYVAATGETVNLDSVGDNPHFAQNFDKASGYQTQSMICTPMYNPQGHIIGVIQLLNKREGIFNRRDEIMLGVLASQAAIAIENARLLASEQEKRQIADTLREVSGIINSAFEVENVLELILSEIERVVPFVGAAILLLEDDYMVVRASRGFGEVLSQSLPLFKLDENALMQEMMQACDPIIIPDVNDDPRWVHIEATKDMHSFLGTPLIVDNRVIGQLSVNHTQANFYTHAHAEVTQTFANQAAAAIERARLHQQTVEQARLQQEVETARTIQTSFLPETEPVIDGWDIAASWQPAKEVAGDFFDFIELPNNRLGFVVADVCGKGIPASLFMALSRTILRVMAQTDLPPDKLLFNVNNQLKSDSSSRLFVTLFYGVLDPQTGELHYCNGGHNPPIITHTDDDETPILDGNGPALGVFPNAAYLSGHVTLNTGDILVVYTDGVTEAINEAEEEFDEERLISCLHTHRHASAHAINASIIDAVKSFSGNRPPDDDATIMVIKRNKPN